MTDKLKPCPICKKHNIVVETWISGGRMHMVKCNNSDCPVPAEGYPTGRHLEDVIEAWNRRAGEQE